MQLGIYPESAREKIENLQPGTDPPKSASRSDTGASRQNTDTSRQLASKPPAYRDAIS